MVDVANVVVIATVAVFLNYLLRRQGRLLETVSGVAEVVQRAVLPDPPTQLGSLRIAARYAAAHTDARIGGDLYVVQDTPYGVRLIIADVRGKGLKAVAAVAIMVGAFRVVADTEADLNEMVSCLEGVLERGLQRRGWEVERWEGFITAVIAEIRPDDRTVRLINRGHPSPLLLHESTVQTLGLAEPDLPLGIGSLWECRSLAETVTVRQGSTLLFMTDGVTEARDRSGEFYDPLTRLSGVGFASPDDLVETLLRDVNRHTGRRRSRQDDTAVLAVTLDRNTHSDEVKADI
ncbi:PP2C family protein-serine/threonine phosphatase [Streptomyces aureoversilis]|uniref:PP2C family protein-serine/threonine phosphatase n=1 Tax=Streptomyces aureoversilis TaxID=67277 RepID=A0ABW0A9B3_9ACTN